ncbi:MAG: hypothetical protein C4336_06850 [Armatimonadota bacterium]
MRILTWLIVVALLWSTPLGAQERSEPEPKPIETTVEAILKDPDSFHKKWVRVEGRVETLKKRVSRAGNKFATFQLGEKQKLTVYTFGHPDIEAGDEVIVVGRFFKEKKVGNNTFENEIDASPREGGKIVKKEKEKEGKEKG